MLIDCHNHSEHSFDGKYSVSAMVSSACKKGIGVFAITDHCELNQWENLNLERTLPESISAIEKQKPLTDLELLTGVELGQPLQNPQKAKEILAKYNFDVVIGSLHNTSGDADYYFLDFVKISDDTIFYMLKKYYLELVEMAKWNGFDTLAHITYPYRYINAARRKRKILVHYESFDEQADLIFETLIRNGKALELNSSSFMRGGKDLDLNIRYLKRYHELGGELVTVGSDAHAPENIGYGIRNAYSLLSDAGFSYVTYFKQRKPIMIKLP